LSRRLFLTGAGFILLVLASSPTMLMAQDQTVKVTPLGLRTGEFCFLDRALLFEDPSGVRILYDPGLTIAGGNDRRLGDVHVILLSHAHGDHLGAAKLNQNPDDPAAKCDPTFVQKRSSELQSRGNSSRQELGRSGRRASGERAGSQDSGHSQSAYAGMRRCGPQQRTGSPAVGALYRRFEF